MDKALFMYHLNLNDFTVTGLANLLPLSRQSLHDKICGRVDFKASEIKMIKKILKLNAKDVDNIFFKEIVSQKDTA